MKRWIFFMIGRHQFYMVPGTGTVLSEEEFRAHCKKDYDAGYRDRMNGYYDKWYRYNRLDGGRSYDDGQRDASEKEDAPDHVHYIEVVEASIH